MWYHVLLHCNPLPPLKDKINKLTNESQADKGELFLQLEMAHCDFHVKIKKDTQRRGVIVCMCEWVCIYA